MNQRATLESLAHSARSLLEAVRRVAGEPSILDKPPEWLKEILAEVQDLSNQAALAWAHLDKPKRKSPAKTLTPTITVAEGQLDPKLLAKAKKAASDE